jgi:putative lipoic acid-binding regulatory protein
MSPSPRFEELLEFPNFFVFRVIGAPGSAAGEEYLRCLRDFLSRDAVVVGVQASAQGHYEVFRVKARVDSAEELRAAYAALSALPGVKMVL